MSFAGQEQRGVMYDIRQTRNRGYRKANILNKYFISVLTEEHDILNSLPDVPDANPQHM